MNSNYFPLLSLLIWTPILGGFLLLFINEKKTSIIKTVGIIFTSIPLLLSLFIIYIFDSSSYSLQFIENRKWIENLNINYFLAIDGISILFILLTTIISSVIIFFSFSEERNQNHKFISWFLFIEGLLLGVFCGLDSILFYIFFESMLIPLFLIIGIWGGPNRVYATIKFFIYTLFGSVLMLVAILYLAFKANSFLIF